MPNCTYKKNCADCEYHQFCHEARGDSTGHKPTAEELVRVLMCGEDICTNWGFHCETGFCDRANTMVDALHATPPPSPDDTVCVEHKTINGVLTPITYYSPLTKTCFHPTREGEPCVGQRHDACPLKKRK